jgi:TPR repeat protein
MKVLGAIAIIAVLVTAIFLSAQRRGSTSKPPASEPTVVPSRSVAEEAILKEEVEAARGETATTLATIPLSPAQTTLTPVEREQARTEVNAIITAGRCAGLLRRAREGALSEPELAVGNKLLEPCRSTSETPLRDALATVEQWALKGSVDAQMLYGDVITNDDIVELLKDEELLRRAKQNRITFLEMAAAQGTPDALQQLSFAYEDGMTVRADPILAYAYQIAANATGRYPLGSRRLDHLESRLSPEQLERARVLGQTINARFKLATQR